MDTLNRGSQLDKILEINLLEGNSQLAAMIKNPFLLQVTILNPSTTLDEETPLAFFYTLHRDAPLLHADTDVGWFPGQQY